MLSSAQVRAVERARHSHAHVDDRHSFELQPNGTWTPCVPHLRPPPEDDDVVASFFESVQEGGFMRAYMQVAATCAVAG